MLLAPEESVFLFQLTALKPAAGVTTTRIAMFLPSAEPSSTLPAEPTLSLPSTLVSSSTKDSTVFRSWPAMTSSEKAASPIDAILPDWDGLSGAGADLVGIN